MLRWRAFITLLETDPVRSRYAVRDVTVWLCADHDLDLVPSVRPLGGDSFKGQLAFLNLIADLWSKHFERDMRALMLAAEAVEKLDPSVSCRIVLFGSKQCAVASKLCAGPDSHQ